MPINFNERVRQITIQQRNRAVMRNRLAYGIKSFCRRPWTVVLPLLLVGFTAFICCNLDNIPFPVSSSTPELLQLWKAATALLTVTVAVLLLWGLLVALGTPRKARSVDNRLEHIGLVDRYGIGPALVSRQKVTGQVVRMTFYSKGIGMERWVQRQGAISDVLTVHLVEPIAYGRDSNYIVLTVAPGVGGHRDTPLYDDEL